MRLSSPSVDQGAIVIASIIVTTSVVIVLTASLLYVLYSRKDLKTRLCKSSLDPATATTTTPSDGDCVKANPCASPASPYPAPGDALRPLGSSGSALLVVASASGGNISSTTTHVNGGFRDADMMTSAAVGRFPVSASGDVTLDRRSKQVTCQMAMNRRRLPEIPKSAFVTCPGEQLRLMRHFEIAELIK